MANIKSAKKRILVNETKAARNKAIKSKVKTAVKKVEAAVAAKDTETAKAALHTAISKVAGMEVKTIFTSADLPDYQVYNSHECELCKEGQKLTGLINSFGFVEL